MTFQVKDGPELYDPITVDALLNRYPVNGASRADQAAAVQQLMARGMRVAEVAERLSLDERQVYRLNDVQIAPYPDMAAEYDHSERRAKHLEQVVDTAMSMAVDMRTQSHLTHAVLTSMTRQELIEVAMTLAAMVDPDRTVKQTLGWVNPGGGIAQVIPIRKEMCDA